MSFEREHSDEWQEHKQSHLGIIISKLAINEVFARLLSSAQRALRSQNSNHILKILKIAWHTEIEGWSGLLSSWLQLVKLCRAMKNTRRLTTTQQGSI